MALSPGTRIGVFEIADRVGIGGMGEVYRARDTTLGRDVAIKVLSDTFSGDPERLARLEREAKLLAALNHPNIATIYGIEEGPANAGPYRRAIVLEYVEGDTLADRIAMTNRRRGLSLDETLTIARQIVDALDAAHERGIAHRDLKPANIKIRPDGTVKVLDFGIAKAGASTVDTMPDALTVESHATNAGIILGSPGYMSPEQARGQSTDKRTDIWAFGCVLFEMLTGRAPFGGATASDVIVATLTKEPDWSLVSDEVPDAIVRLLRRCLHRDPRRRLRDIGDAYADVHEAIDQPRAPARGSAAPPRPVTFQRLTDRIGVSESPAVSPDGRMVAFVSPVSGRRQIWVRLLAGGAPLQITSDERDHAHPRWTVDGTAIIYFAKAEPGEELGTIMEVSALGGPSRPLVSALNGADISHDGRLALFEVRDGKAHLVTVSRDDGRVVDVAVGPKGYSCELPRWSPDGRWLAFHATRIGQLQERLFVVEASGRGEPQPVARATAIKGASWLPDSSGLVFSSSAGSTLPYPPTCNLRRIQRDGTGDQAITFGDMSYVDPDVHASGKLLVCRIRSQSDVWRIPVTGSPAENTSGAIRITRQSGQVQTPSVSPDGSEVVYLSDNGGHSNLWVAKTDSSGRAKQITFEQDESLLMGIPIWSPADNRIVFVRGRDRLALWLVNSDGRGLRQLVAHGIAPSWSPDGKWIYYSPLADNEEWRIEKIPVAGGITVLVRNDDNHAPAVGHGVLHFVRRVGGATVEGWDWEFHRANPENGPSEVLTRVSGYRSPVSQIFASASLSRDGRWLALPLIDGATCNLGVMPADGGEFQLVTDFGDRPTIIARQVSWAPDGKSIYAAVAEINGDIVLLDGLI